MMTLDELTAAKLLNCCVVMSAWLLTLGVGAAGLLTMVAIG